MKKNWLLGKTVIVTGASSGIGKSLCVSLVQKYGCRVIGVARNEERLRCLQTLLGENFSYEIFDVGVKENWQNFKDLLQKRNTVPDILVNNAGILPPFQRFERLDGKEFERVMQTNFFSVVYACEALLPLLKKSSTPAVLNISSSAALCALPGITPYAASKAAVKSFTESLAAEYAKKTFYVGLVMPGFTLTDIFREQKTDEKTNKMLSTIATPCEKMSKKIEKTLLKRKRRKIFGLDAKGMNLLYKLFPARAARICGNVLNLFKVTTFEDVFEK